MSDETVDRQGPVSTRAPGTWQPTEEEVAAVVQVLSDEGLHLSWRCFDKGHHPELCRCLHAVAGIILTAVGPAIAARARAETLIEVETRIRGQAKAAPVGSPQWRAHIADLAHVEGAWNE
jgi:hypothetical protein